MQAFIVYSITNIAGFVIISALGPGKISTTNTVFSHGVIAGSLLLYPLAIGTFLWDRHDYAASFTSFFKGWLDGIHASFTYQIGAALLCYNRNIDPVSCNNIKLLLR